MNAKMILTVPIEEIPEEVSKILERIVERINNIKDKISNCAYNQDHNLVINQLDEARKLLSLVDYNIEDCYSVLLGYVKYQTDKKIQTLDLQKSTQGSNNDSNING